jgi:hypothetical protein
MIGWYVHHVGLGHATRAVAVARHLQSPVTGFGSGPPPVDWPGRWLPLDRDDTHPAPGEHSDVTARGTLHWVPRYHPGLASRNARVVEWLHRERPDVVVVDVSVEIAVLARLCGIPVVVVAGPGSRQDRAHLLAYDLADALLAPWPEGTHDGAWPRGWRSKTWCVGALSRFDGAAVTAPSTGRASRRVLVLWGAGGRDSTAAQVEAARAATPAWTWSERRPGSPGSLWRDLLAADVVVTHAGQNAVAEVAAARRPAVVVAQTRPHAEQEATARAVDALGAATGLLTWPEATAWPELLDRALARGGGSWAAWSSGDGAQRAAAHVERLARRRTLPVGQP